MLNIVEGNWQQIVFYIFAAMALAAASMVVIAKHPVRAVLFLIVTFFMTAATWVLLEFEFLAMVLILVYVGAVMVLFLFVVMMLDVDYAAIKAKFTRYLPLGICIPVLLLILLISAVGPQTFANIELVTTEVNNVRHLGELLFTDYLFHLQIAGVLLLVAIVAAISLTFRGARRRKSQVIHQQVKIKAKDRISFVGD